MRDRLTDVAAELKPAETRVTPEALFEVLVREHADMLLAYLQSLVDDDHVIDDIFQDTVVVAWRSMDRFDKERSFGRWLRGIARKLILAHNRKKRAGPVATTPEVLDIVDARWEEFARRPGDTLEEKLAALKDCVDRLPEKYRTAIDTRYLRERRGKELAAALKTSVENSKKLLQRGRNLLSRCLQQSLPFKEGDHDRRPSQA